MGHALAEAALRRGARVVLVSGPVAIKPPAVQEVVLVETAAEMRRETMARLTNASVILKTAAVADYTVATSFEQKLKRKGTIALELEPTADILAEIGRTKGENQILVGFAAETENVLENARKKLKEKRCDIVVVNDVSRAGIGFDSERNSVTIISDDDLLEVPEMSKWEVAHRVLDSVVQIRQRKKQISSVNIR
jgi:phosphopantothenoylcysteine decarboxylase/phosphopantothenate--cysteine ligase